MNGRASAAHDLTTVWIQEMARTTPLVGVAIDCTRNSLYRGFPLADNR